MHQAGEMDLNERLDTRNATASKYKASFIDIPQKVKCYDFYIHFIDYFV